MKQLLPPLFFLIMILQLQAQELGTGNAVRIYPGETPREIYKKAAHVVPTSRQADWQELEFTIFIHFGMNTFTNREWGEKGTSPSLFNPTALDAGQWVATAKMAGARLVIMVAKHHDGFCLWPTRFSDYSIKNSPWKGGKGDILAEVAAACKKQGMKLGVYISPWDINSPLYGTEAYNEHFRNQLTELLTHYGPIDEVWFDGACGEGPNGKRQVYDWLSYYRVIRKLQPKAVIAISGPDVRWVGTESGYGRETEWSVIPAKAATLNEIKAGAGKGSTREGLFFPPGDMMEQDLGSRAKIEHAAGLIWYPSEVDVSIRPGWFYHQAEDSLVKSPATLEDIWYSSVGRNSVLLLNLPPDRRGLIHENDVAALKKMKTVLDATFGNNLAKDADIFRNDSLIQLDLRNPAVFDRVMLREDFRHGQKVEAFILETWDGGSWNLICRGTTIGYKRLLRFDPVRSGKIRLRITSSRDVPEILEFGLYKEPAEQP
ncbi:MAG: alpha-L-fucosidase [Bacteroidota bacterium]